MVSETTTVSESAGAMPGIYAGMSFTDYNAIEAVNHSLLKFALKTPAHYKHQKDHPSEESKECYEFGEGYHVRILQPEEWSRRLVVEPEINARSSTERAQLTEWRARQPADALVLTDDEIDRIEGMREALLRNEDARRIIEAPGHAEVVVVWDDPATGVRCKMRADWLLVGTLGLDLKSTRGASREDFGRAILDYGYFRQMAMYEDGSKAQTGADTEFLLIAQEKDGSFEAATYTVGEPSIALGRYEYRTALRQIAWCEKQGFWPGYGWSWDHKKGEFFRRGVEAIDVPLWKLRNFDSDL